MSMFLCGCKDTGKNSMYQAEDKNAKQLLQGIWVSDDDGQVVMKVKGDSIIYADSTLVPVCFAIYGDTLVTKSYTETHYAIIKQTPHVFQFTNVSGDPVNLTKSDNADDDEVFAMQQPASLTINQGQTINRDTVLHHADKTIHAYVQVKPSDKKVVTNSVNESGMKTDNVYHDNNGHIKVTCGNQLIYTKNINKQYFIGLVPKSFLQQAILSDITVDGVGDDGVHFLVSILQPDSQTSYVVRLTVSLYGKMTKSLCN